jgi:hypothetical protein
LPDSLGCGATLEVNLLAYQAWRAHILERLAKVVGEMSVSAINRAFGVEARAAER